MFCELLPHGFSLDDKIKKRQVINRLPFLYHRYQQRLISFTHGFIGNIKMDAIIGSHRYNYGCRMAAKKGS